MDCYGNILHEKGLSNSTQFLMEGISCVTPTKRLYLTNRFQVAVLLFSNRSRMTSKCGKSRLWFEPRILAELDYQEIDRAQYSVLGCDSSSGRIRSSGDLYRIRFPRN